ncbi:MAG: tripartite tricarboxylate transporter TctB family protein [Rhodothermales bacterium]
MNQPLRNVISGLFLVGLGLWIWIYTGTFPTLQGGHPGPALFPRVVAVGLGLAGLGLVVGALRRWEKLRQALRRPQPSWPGVLRLVLGLSLVALYPVLQSALGFIPTVALLSFSVAYMLKARPLVAALTAVLGAVAIYWTFTGLLGVPL